MGPKEAMCPILSFASLTQSGQPLQLVLVVSTVRSADLENLVLAVAAGLTQQRPVGTWNQREAENIMLRRLQHISNTTEMFIYEVLVQVEISSGDLQVQLVALSVI